MREHFDQGGILKGLGIRFSVFLSFFLQKKNPLAQAIYYAVTKKASRRDLN